MALFDTDDAAGKQPAESPFGAVTEPAGQPSPRRGKGALVSPPSDMLDQVGNLSRRLKMLEERSANISNRIQLTDHNTIESTKKLHSEIRAHTDELQEMRQKLREIEEKIGLIIREFKNVPRKEDMKVLEKYITLWNPMEFVTRTQAERIVEEILERRKDLLQKKVNKPSEKEKISKIFKNLQAAD